jgi:hypothetical protein
MPGQIGGHAETLKKLGLGVRPGALTDPTAFPLNAVVSLGGCSASFVSPDGLMVTNHHCVTRYLQHNATPGAEPAQGGYLAKTRADEKSGGPTARVYVTTAFTDVTDKVLGGLEAVTDGAQRFKQIEERRKQVTNTCEAGRPEIAARSPATSRARSSSRSSRSRSATCASCTRRRGHRQLRRRGRQLAVAAPHRRLLVPARLRRQGRQARRLQRGQRAVQAPAPPEGRRATRRRDGGFVLVAGYPGRTQRLKTAAEAQQAADWYYSRQIALTRSTSRCSRARQGPPRAGDQVGGQAARAQELLQELPGRARRPDQGRRRGREGPRRGRAAEVDRRRRRPQGQVRRRARPDGRDGGREGEDPRARHGPGRAPARSACCGSRTPSSSWPDRAREARRRAQARLPGARRRRTSSRAAAMESASYAPRTTARLRLFLQRAARLPEAERPAAAGR